AADAQWLAAPLRRRVGREMGVKLGQGVAATSKEKALRRHIERGGATRGTIGNEETVGLDDESINPFLWLIQLLGRHGLERSADALLSNAHPSPDLHNQGIQLAFHSGSKVGLQPPFGTQELRNTSTAVQHDFHSLNGALLDAFVQAIVVSYSGFVGAH